jgi:hypothetical protein
MTVPHRVPLLEFDPDPVGVVDPSVAVARVRDTIPERVVMCFYAEILAALPEEAERVGELEAAHGILKGPNIGSGRSRYGGVRQMLGPTGEGICSARDPCPRRTSGKVR